MAAKEKNPSVPVATLAQLFGISAVRIQQLAADGHLVKQGRGQYDLWGSIRGYIKFLQGKKSNQWDDGGGEGNGDYAAHRARLTAAKADMAEIQANTLKGNVHEAGAVEAVWTDMLQNARTKLLSIPSRLAPSLRKETNLPKVKLILETAITAALNELAAYDPDRVTQQYISTHREDVAAATEVDGEPVG